MAIISDMQEEEASPQQQQPAPAPAGDVDLDVLAAVLERKGGALPFLHAAIDVAARRSDLFRDPSAVDKVTAMASAARAQVEAEERRARDAKRKAEDAERVAAGKERAAKAAAAAERMESSVVTEERAAGSSGEKGNKVEMEQEGSKARRMSELVEFVVYYGVGSIRIDKSGSVNLSSFPQTRLTMQDPDRYHISVIKNWFTRSFGLDPEVASVTLQAYFSKSCKYVRWDLFPLDHTKDWRNWLSASKARKGSHYLLVQAVDKEVPSEEGGGGGNKVGQSSLAAQKVVGEEGTVVEGGGPNARPPATGVTEYLSGSVNEGEIHQELVQIMEHDDALVRKKQMNIEDGSNEEDEAEDKKIGDDPIPNMWNTDMSTIMNVEGASDNRYSYKPNEIGQGAFYGTKKEVKEAVKLWAMSTHKTFRVQKSCKDQYSVKCKSAGCEGYVHASLRKYEVQWVIRRLVPHTCVINGALDPIMEHDTLRTSADHGA